MMRLARLALACSLLAAAHAALAQFLSPYVKSQGGGGGADLSTAICTSPLSCAAGTWTWAGATLVGTPAASNLSYWTGASTQALLSGSGFLLMNGASSPTLSSSTGTGSVVLATSPTLVTPVLGVASATTINKVTLTAPTGGSTLTIADGKTATVNNSITFAGTDTTTMTFPSTSATIARTDAANTWTGHQTFEGVTSTGATGTGKFVFDTSPTFTTSAISPLFRSTAAKVLVQGTGTGATQLAATQTTAPTCTTNCGSASPTVAGTDTAGIITLGTTPASAFQVNFNGTWASAPACIVQSALSSMVVGKMPIAVVTSTTTMVVTTNGTAPATSDKYQYVCVGTQ